MPGVDFKVTLQQLVPMAVNGCSGGSFVVFITVTDKNGAPLDRLVIQQMYLANITPAPTGDKGPGKTEAISGDAYRIKGDTGGKAFSSDWTKGLANVDAGISNADLIGGGFCANDADCNQRKADNALCNHHYSWRVAFQRTW